MTIEIRLLGKTMERGGKFFDFANMNLTFENDIRTFDSALVAIMGRPTPTRKRGRASLAPRIQTFGEPSMIAASRRIRDFVDTVKDCGYEEILLMAEAEATAAERMMYKHGRRGDGQPLPGSRYARDLKRLISFMRYGVKPPGIPPEDLQLYHRMRRPTRPSPRPANC
jgi:hypothetical protein